MIDNNVDNDEKLFVFDNITLASIHFIQLDYTKEKLRIIV